MRVILDNAQNTSHIDVIDAKGVIQLQISFCSDGVLINDKSLSDYPIRDDILLYKEKTTSAKAVAKVC
jgi:hypothetical protein